MIEKVDWSKIKITNAKIESGAIKSLELSNEEGLKIERINLKERI